MTEPAPRSERDAEMRRRERAAAPDAVARTLTIRAQEIVSLRANTSRAVEALEGHLTPDEKTTILAAVDRAGAAPAAALAVLHTSLDDLESAARVIAAAMLRSIEIPR